MDKIFIAISDYLTQKNVPPILALHIESPVNPEAMVRLGFRQENNIWIINKEDASDILSRRLNIQPAPNWTEHWQQEVSRSLGRA